MSQFEILRDSNAKIQNERSRTTEFKLKTVVAHQKDYRTVINENDFIRRYFLAEDSQRRSSSDWNNSY